MGTTTIAVGAALLLALAVAYLLLAKRREETRNTELQHQLLVRDAELIARKVQAEHLIGRMTIPPPKPRKPKRQLPPYIRPLAIIGATAAWLRDNGAATVALTGTAAALTLTPSSIPMEPAPSPSPPMLAEPSHPPANPERPSEPPPSDPAPSEPSEPSEPTALSEAPPAPPPVAEETTPSPAPPSASSSARRPAGKGPPEKESPGRAPQTESQDRQEPPGPHPDHPACSITHLDAGIKDLCVLPE